MNSALHRIIDSAREETKDSCLKAAGFKEETSAVYVLDRSGAIIDTNEALIGFTGIPIEKLNGELLADFLNEPGRQALQAMVKDKDPSGVHAFEGAVINGKSESLSIRAMVHPLFDEKGNAMGFVVHMQEKQSDNELEARKAALSQQDVFSLISDAVIECDSSLRLTYINLVGTRLFGWKKNQSIIDRPLPDFIHPDDREEALRTMEECLARGRNLEFSARLLREDGAGFPAEIRICTAGTEKDNEGQILRLVVKDLSTKREAQRFRKLFKSFIGLKPEGVVFVLEDGSIELANQHMASLFGYTDPEHLRGVNINRLIESRILKFLTGPEKEKLESVSLQMVRARAVSKEGKKFQVALTGLVITDEHGEPDGLVCSVNEIKDLLPQNETRKNNTIKEKNHG